MKNILKIVFALIGLVLCLGPASTVVAQTLHISAGSATALLVGALAVVSHPALKIGSLLGVTRNGIELEVWVNYLIKRFWKDNSFLKHVHRDDQYVLAGKVVHIPQIGAKPVVVKNRSSFPAAAVGRTDTDVTYALDVYTSDPTHIQDAEKHEVSYDKIDSVLGDHAAAVNETIADDTIIKFLTGISAGAKMQTTGGATAATAPDATGNRKLLLPADLRMAMTRMNVANVPKDNRFVMPSANMLDHLIQNMSDTQYKDFSSYMDAKNGVIGKLFTFTFLDRSSTAVADNTHTVKALGAASAVTDNEVTLLWQKDSLAAALGEVKYFDNINDPQYYGDIYSALMRAGGRRRRSDDKGIIMLSQAALSLTTPMKLFLEKLLKGFDYHSYGEWWCSLAPSYKYDLTALGMGVSAIATGIETVFGMTWLAFLGFLIAMVFELSSGVYASTITKKEDFSSLKLSKFSFKTACYLVLIGLSHVFYLSFQSRNLSLAAGAFQWLHIFLVTVIITEVLTSILENLAVISGKDKTHWISKIQNKINGLIK